MNIIQRVKHISQYYNNETSNSYLSFSAYLYTYTQCVHCSCLYHIWSAVNVYAF